MALLSRAVPSSHCAAHAIVSHRSDPQPQISMNAVNMRQIPTSSDEIYHKIKSMKDIYFSDLHELHRKIASKLQQHESIMLPRKESQLEALKKYKKSIEHIMQLLLMPKSKIPPIFEQKIPILERQIIALVNSKRTVRSMALGSVNATCQNKMNSLQPCSNVDISQVSMLNPLLQGATSSLHWSELGTLHQAQQKNSANALFQNKVNMITSTVNPSQQDSNRPQYHQINQDKMNCAEPIERLIKVVKSSSALVLKSAINDIFAIVSMADWVPGAAPGNGSWAAVDEDLASTTKCHLQARNFLPQDVTVTRKRQRQITALSMPSTSSGNEGVEESPALEIIEFESRGRSDCKRRKIEASNGLVNEIRAINQQLIETTVDVADEDIDSVAAKDGGGT